MANYLPEAIESVLTQDYPRLEYIVVDGGSTDGSLEILERYKDRLSYTSGPDRGPSDAAFKGLERAHGEILTWLNADDSFLPGAISTAVAYLQAHPQTDVVYGEGWWIDELGAVISRYPTLAFDAKVLERDCFICQPAAFLRASAYRRVPLDPKVERSSTTISGFAWSSPNAVSIPSRSIWPTRACIAAPRPSMSEKKFSRHR